MRRAPIIAAAALVLGGAIVLVGGRIVANPVAAVAPAPEHPEIVAAPAPAAAPVSPRPPQTASRLVAPKIVAPPEIDPGELQREPARAPLGELGLAQPPKPEVLASAGTPFYRPVAVESAVFESMGHRVSIAGARSVPLNEICLVAGISWRCGVRARTAFRLWLRGRALVCALPDEPDAAVVAAQCRMGKQDAGAWLVSNGWARATPGGPYVKAGEEAQTAKMGIFGPPPDTSGLKAVPEPTASSPLADQRVLIEQDLAPEPEPAPAPEPRLEFPPAPPAP